MSEVDKKLINKSGGRYVFIDDNHTAIFPLLRARKLRAVLRHGRDRRLGLPILQGQRLRRGKAALASVHVLQGRRQAI
jgi:hypothetical protein